jgi:hypothetical protein
MKRWRELQVRPERQRGQLLWLVPIRTEDGEEAQGAAVSLWPMGERDPVFDARGVFGRIPVEVIRRLR